MNTITRFTYAILVLGAVAATAMEEHSNRLYRSPIAVGTTMRPSLLAPLTSPLTDKSRATIYIRYLGYTCSHCVRQLVYLNDYAKDLRRLGVDVVAFSSDDTRTSNKMVAAMGLQTDVIRIVSDVENDVARAISALRVEDDTVRDLHAVLVVRDGVLAFAAYTEEPFMDIERLIGAATAIASTDGGVRTDDGLRIDGGVRTDDGKGAASGTGLRSYADGFTVRTIATANNGVREPKDLEFNSSVLHPNDLWVVMAEPNGHAMLIVHDAGKATQAIRRKKDYRASHFMWRTQALAFGKNGTFGTAQNGEPGGGDLDYQFMGPTLWSSDTAIFASKYQEEDGRLASHLDMLHQNAYCLGIAHERDNVYWISDALHGTIGRYDFNDPHEVGGSDHRDGVIRNYTSAQLTSTEHGRPAHIAFDAEKRWLYYINPGANSIMRIDTRTGTDTRQLFPTVFSDENLTSFREFTGSTVEPVLQLTKDVRPVGLHVDGNSLIVGNTDGTILIYDIAQKPALLKHTLDVSPAIVGGVTVGPDGRIWFVDPDNATVNVVDPDLKETLVATDVIRVIPSSKTLSMELGIVRPNCDIASYAISVIAPDGWTVSHPDTVTITAAGPPNFVVDATPDSSAMAGPLVVYAKAIQGEGVLSTSIIISRSDIRRIVVNDATTESFDIVEAVNMAGRKGYTSITSDIFLQLVDSLPDIQTMVWNSGSFGEINMAEEIVMHSLAASEREIFLIADDPLLLRADLPNASSLFAEFGARLAGADVDASDDGSRTFQGVPSDPITGGMTGLQCQLPRLNHERGGQFVPNVKLALNKQGSFSMLVRKSSTIIGAIRYAANDYRSILCGINLGRFVDTEERTQFIDKSLAWLEQAETKIPDPTDVASETPAVNRPSVVRAIGQNPFPDVTSIRVTAHTPYADVTLYTIAGQRVATLWQGAVEGSIDIAVDGRAISNGTYYVIYRDASTSSHCTIVKRQ